MGGRLGTQLLDHMISFYLALYETARVSYKAARI